MTNNEHIYDSVFVYSKKSLYTQLAVFILLCYTVVYDFYVIKMPFDIRIILLKAMCFLIPNILFFFGIKRLRTLNNIGYCLWLFYAYAHTKFVSVSYFVAYIQLIFLFTLCADLDLIFIHLGFILSIISSYDAILHTHRSMSYFSDTNQGNQFFYIFLTAVLSVNYYVYMLILRDRLKKNQELTFSLKGKSHDFIMQELITPITNIKHKPENAPQEIEKIQQIINTAKAKYDASKLKHG